MGTVRAADPSDKNAFDFVERIEERLGRPEAARYDLAYSIVTETVGVGITPDNQITRYNLKGAIDWTLSDTATGARITGVGCKVSPPLRPPAAPSRAWPPRKTPPTA